ncbi:RNA polymerase sigma factor [Sphingobacterium psychroaquaticum]|uniref:RNA polymerase sigma-70 factor, ECF subfamily n=1 Tax=Sphingobacterium psychroaquaticum TaxID=561061 RepID=A0A1X7KSC2_9SPHI|nr:RNA polymerase sigma-70 factor [Sphingobacterium psychroaquaticum]QBQ40606.1 RNA polymerase sigma-70 factor [Sphingobacterium psychroaquaticum]SMG44049.1 RNA polymerase sigma-70 factor, ECF subfamily [Sphingobacterium psychroaquaticum]
MSPDTATLPFDSEEKYLLSLLKEGDYAAFESIYHNYSLRILGRIIRLVRSKHIAEEVLQELFLKVWEKREQIDLNRSFRSFLFSIAQNIVYDHFRRVSLDDKFRSMFIQNYHEDYAHIEEELVFKQSQEQLMQAIAKLPPQCQRVFILFKLEGKSYAEIAEMLRISKSTINNHITKANGLLKEELPFYQSHLVIVSLLLFKFF